MSGEGSLGRKPLEAEMNLTERGKLLQKLCRESKNDRHHAYVGEMLYDPQPVAIADSLWDIVAHKMVSASQWNHKTV